MPKKLTNINFMMELAASYLADKSMSRCFFEDVLHLELEQRYRKMAFIPVTAYRTVNLRN